MPSRTMRSMRALVAAGLLTAALAPVGGITPVALADCATIGLSPATLDAAAGTTFIGEPISRQDDGDQTTEYVWQIERVYDGPVKRGRSTFSIGPCTGAHPSLGRRYLVSTVDPDAMSSQNTLLWQIRRDGSLKLKRTNFVVDDPLPEVRALHTLPQALDALVPDWSGRIPRAPQHREATINGTWLPMAAAPFGTTEAAWAWTGSELVIAAGEQAAAWDEAADTWRSLPAPPRPVSAGAHGVFTWTGTELLTWGPLGEADTRPLRGLALDPATGTWRELPPLPMAGNVIAATWTGDRAVVVTDVRGTAAFDPATDTWTPMQPLGAYADLVEDGEAWLAGRLVTAAGVTFALDWERPDVYGARIWQLDPETGRWTAAGESTFYAARGATPLPDGRLLFAGRDGRFDDGDDPATVIDLFHPTDGTTLTRVTDCLVASGSSPWTGRLLVGTDRALDPLTGRCLRIPPAVDDRNRVSPIEVWTGTELIRWSGGGGEELPALPDGVRFVPMDPDAMGPGLVG